MLVDLCPREVAGGVGLQVGDEAVGVPALLLVPDDLVEDHLVADVGVAGGHEPRERGEVLALAHRAGDPAVVAVAEDDAPAHQVVGGRHAREDVVEGLDAELVEQFAVVGDRRGAPGVQRHVVGAGGVRPAVGTQFRRGSPRLARLAAIRPSGASVAPRVPRLAAVLVGRCVVVGRVVVGHGVSRLTASQRTSSLAPVSAKTIRFRTPWASRTSSARSRGSKA